MGRRIVIASFGSLGDLHPCLAMGRELTRRGHSAVIVTTDLYRERVGAAGLEFRAMRPEHTPELEAKMLKVMHLREGPRRLIRDIVMPTVRESYADLLAACEGADFLIAGEVVYAAPLVAETLGLRWAGLILSPFSFFSAQDPAVVPGAEFLRDTGVWANRWLVRLGRWGSRGWARPVDELRRELGLKGGGHPLFDDKFSSDLNLVLFSPLLAERQVDWPAGARPTGFVFYDGGGSVEGLEEFLRGGEAPVVFTLGSAAVHRAGDFFEQSLAAARRVGRRALLIGRLASGDGVLGVEYAPYSEVFGRAAVIVHQGGSGTTGQAMRAGVPQLVVPFGFDQPDNGARIERLGLGLTLARSRYQATRVAQVLREILESRELADTASWVGGRMRLEDGLGAACDQVEAAMMQPPVE